MREKKTDAELHAEESGDRERDRDVQVWARAFGVSSDELGGAAGYVESSPERPDPSDRHDAPEDEEASKPSSSRSG